MLRVRVALPCNEPAASRCRSKGLCTPGTLVTADSIEPVQCRPVYASDKTGSHDLMIDESLSGSIGHSYDCPFIVIHDTSQQQPLASSETRSSCGLNERMIKS